MPENAQVRPFLWIEKSEQPIDYVDNLSRHSTPGALRFPI